MDNKTVPIITIDDKVSDENINKTDVSDEVLETLFQRYSIKQKRAALECFLIASTLFDIWAIFVPQGQKWESLGITSAFLILNLSLATFLRLCGNCRFRGIIWEIAPHLAWLFAIKQLFFQLFFKGTVTPRDSLGWAILLNFLVYVTLPVPLKYAGLLLGIGSFSIYVNTIIGLAKNELYFWHQQFANYLILIAASVIGIQYYYIGEAKQRRAFLEAKQSLEVKMVIEEQSAEQERLLLSVLPEHVAVKVRQDLGSNDSEQFKKIYMSRHENVSILYADIVGFTAISSTYSAQDLVKMLNDLFARFDRLAEKYHQLRIKILGDCYYCISGAPVERSDHAVLCVYMGLAMVKAIKYVQYKTRSPVDMRVGIHTGAVLAGILGQRQWQFDVYSRDVELANKMESSGLAGRVHISEKTLNFLNGEFEIEPAYGEKREESLRIAGLRTYFITKVVKPFTPVNARNNGTTKTNDMLENISAPEPDEDDDLQDNFECGSGIGNHNDDVTNIEIQIDNKVEDFKRRLRKELVSRDGHGELSKDTTFLLTFENQDLEKAYTLHREPLSSIPLLAVMIVQFVCVVYSSLILQSSFLHFIVIISPFGLMALIVVISIAESFPAIFCERLSKTSKYFNDVVCLRRLAALLTICLLCGSNLLDMFACSMETPKLDGNKSTTITINQSEIFTSTVCLLFPSYFSNVCVLILIAISLLGHLSHIFKIFLMLFFAGLHCCINIFLLEEHFRNEEYHTWNTSLPLRYSLSALLIAVTIALGFLARHMDKEDRVIFKWTTEVADQKEKASDMRRRNEALVYNILPIHVAEHFMRNKARSHDDLYSQSYAEVGVLFASMPNFSDFYSEESVNNQGLECLRFLNEVISDFDALLEIPKYHEVIKIKTIGSTYMAASGLNPSTQVVPDDPISVRWKHLTMLVDFAVDLKKALQCINEQSFNHFVLKMGINHGPITAGVIGARKPHYDIWGNTVNVASRMESTGKAGAVQVTEETCQILQTFGYTFEQRGLVYVKGKGQLMTYYLQGKVIASPRQSSNINTMETVPELDESKDISPTNYSNNNETIATSGIIIQLEPLETSCQSPTTINANNNLAIINHLNLIKETNSIINGNEFDGELQTTTTTIKNITTILTNTNYHNNNNNSYKLPNIGNNNIVDNSLTCNNISINNDCSNNSMNNHNNINNNKSNNKINNNTVLDESTNSIDTELDNEVDIPLLDVNNSINTNTNDFSDSGEKDALISNVN